MKLRLGGLLAVLLLTLAACGGKKSEVVVAEPEPLPPYPQQTDSMGTEDVSPTPRTGSFGVDQPSVEPVLPESGRSPLKDVYFDFDRYDLRADARLTLRENAEWLKLNPGTRVVVEGHCDERGTEEYNLALGDRRAQAARRYLIDLGISPARLSAISYGESRPADPRMSEDAWARNRRAHFSILE